LITYLRAVPGFAVRLAVSAEVIWLFLHGVAQGFGVPAGSWASMVWVLAVGFSLVMVDARQLRYRVFLANLGVSRLEMWFSAWLALAGSEVLLQMALLLL